MPIHTFWDDDACTILRVTFTGRWTWEDLRESNLSKYAMCMESPHRVDLVNDMRTFVYRPAHNGEGPIWATRSIERAPNVGMVVWVVNDFTYALCRPSAARTSGGTEQLFVANMREARQLIARSRAGEKMPDFLPGDGQLN